MRRRRILGYGTLVGIVGAMGLSGCLGRALTYPAPKVPVPPAPAPLREVVLAKGVVAWSGHASAPGPLILFFHGNGENLETLRLSGFLDGLGKLGLPFLAVDYPGYGRSEGSPSEKANLEAAEAALAWAGKRPCVAFGWSLGAGVAVQVAAKHPNQVKGLILASPFTSLPDAAKAHFPSWMVWILLRERYPSLETAPQVKCPVLVIHGEADPVVPCAQGKQMAEALKCRFVPLPGRGHNDLFDDPEAWSEVSAFLKALR